MSWRWISIASLLAALVLGYGAWTGRDSLKVSISPLPAQPGYYLKNAIITQTQESGAPGIRLVASRIEQQADKDGASGQKLTNDSILLHEVRVDYFHVEGKHWVLSAQQGLIPEQSHLIRFTGDVELRPADSQPNTFLRTQTLEIDTDRNIAYATQSPVQIQMGNYRIDVKGFEADLKTEKIKSESLHGTFKAG